MIRETLPYSRYEVREESSYLIDPTYTMSVVVGFLYPSCKEQHDPLDHGERKMRSCGLDMILRGNDLDYQLSTRRS